MSAPAATVRVLHVLGQMQRGGAEMRILEVLGRLCPTEFHADICALSGLAGSLDASVRACGGDVIPIRLDARFPRRFTRLLRHGRYSVVHSHVLHTSGVILALASAAGVPVRIAHFRATHDGRPSTWGRRVQRRIMLHLIDRYATDIIGCGEGAMDAIWRPGWRNDPRCRVIYNAIDVTRFEQPVDRVGVRADLGVPIAARLFVHVGNNVREKNHGRLLAIFAEMKKHGSSNWLALAGSGTDDPKGEIARRIHELDLQDRVVCLGVREDVPQLLKAADALLLPSISEGLPGVVLEASAAGVPVLATDLPGVREIAARLPLVRVLPLSTSDAEWAAVASSLPDEAERMELRATAPDALRASVFHVDRAAEAHRILWGRAVQQGTLACS